MGMENNEAGSARGCADGKSGEGAPKRSTATVSGVVTIKAGRSVKKPRLPSMASVRNHTTMAYNKYDARFHQVYPIPEVDTDKISREDWKGYPLYIDDYTDHDEVPTNARIDDYTVAQLIDSGKGAKWLNPRWPCDFDKQRMVKAIRMPLGFSAKMHVDVGDVDRKGRPADKGGWYYKWYHGVHLLCGEEGLKKYTHRPSLEETGEETWYFDIDCKCVYQEDERGEEESQEVLAVIGSRPVAAKVPIKIPTKKAPRKSPGDQSGGIPGKINVILLNTEIDLNMDTVTVDGEEEEVKGPSSPNVIRKRKRAVSRETRPWRLRK